MNYRRTFIYPESNSFPVIIRCSKQYLNCFQFIRCLHLANVKIGNLFSYTYFLSPYIVMFSFIFKYSCIQRKSLKRKFVFISASHFALFCPGSCKWICICAFQHIWANCPDIIFISACKIDIPFSIQIMKFRCPDMFTHNSFFVLFPDRHFFCAFQSRQSFTSS